VKRSPARKPGTSGTKGTSTKNGKNGKPKKPMTPKAWVLRVLKWGGITGLVLALVGAGTFVFLYQTIDIPKANDEFLDEQSTILYSDESRLGTFALQKRDYIALSDMPDSIKEAVVAAENQSFWTDSGIDPKGIVRAVFNNASGNSTQGASTITQQYVKILYLTQEQSYTRKIKEAILSLKIQRQMTKEQLLEGYLNAIYFGRGAYGIETAAEAFFRKPAKDLRVPESAVLASVLNNPTGYDPANGKEAREALKERYDYVLSSMVDMGNITQEQADKFSRKLPTIKPVSAESTYGGQRGHLLTMVRKELLRTKDKDGDFFTEEDIDGGGLQVTTTFDPKVMDAAEQGVIEGRPEGFGDKELHVGVASVEPGTGAVRGIYAGQDYLQSQLNWAVAGGQAGSTFKAFAVAAGIKAGFSLKDTFDGNSPYEMPDGSPVENQGDRDYGRVSLTTATANSVNTAFMDMTVAMDNGEQEIIDMANAMGIPPDDDNEEYRRRGPGFPNFTDGLDEQGQRVSLGAQTVSPINMANGYATIANGGMPSRPYIIERVVGPDGEELYEHTASASERAVSEDIAADTSYALQQVVEAGSGDAAQDLGRPAAGKTGTATNTAGDVTSAWFTGYTPQLATSVVYVRGKGVGKLDGWLPSYFGGDYPAETWTEVMTRAMEDVEIEEFPEPVYVDGDAPEEGHAPYVPPPPPTKKPTKTPSTPVTEDPTPTEPTKPTKPPKPTDPTEPTEPTEPTDSCGLLGGCPSDEPGQPDNSPAQRTAATSTEPWWSRWLVRAA
jgi:membrane peptidoglycan carboxypeptidase